MTVDLMRGMPNAGVSSGTKQEDGGIRVALMSDLSVHLTDQTGQYTIDMPAFLAIDVGQRLVQMGTEALRRTIAELEDKPLDVNPQPKIDIVRGNFPKKRL